MVLSTSVRIRTLILTQNQVVDDQKSEKFTVQTVDKNREKENIGNTFPIMKII